MLSEFLQSLVAHARERLIVEVGDKTFTRDTLKEVKPEDPKLPAKIQVSTLQGFADLIREGIDSNSAHDLNLDKFVIHVKNETEVVLIDADTDKFGRRLELLKATPVPFEQFKFGSWLSQEEFVIAVAARFSPTTDKDYVLRLASSMTNEAVATNEDNGFSQRVQVKAGMKLPENETVKATVNLAPFRTFPEVGQPISQFVFRARNGQSGPQLMLVEADGGKWKIDAINEVRRVLATFELEQTIIA